MAQMLTNFHLGTTSRKRSQFQSKTPKGPQVINHLGQLS